MSTKTVLPKMEASLENDIHQHWNSGEGWGASDQRPFSVAKEISVSLAKEEEVVEVVPSMEFFLEIDMDTHVNCSHRMIT